MEIEKKKDGNSDEIEWTIKLKQIQLFVGKH